MPAAPGWTSSSFDSLPVGHSGYPDNAPLRVAGGRTRVLRSAFVPATKSPLGSGLRGPDGGQGGNRTPDTGIFNPLLYQLSYLAGTLHGQAVRSGNDTDQPPAGQGRLSRRERGRKLAGPPRPRPRRRVTRAVSSAVEHCLHTARVSGSIPLPPTIAIDSRPSRWTAWLLCTPRPVSAHV